MYLFPALPVYPRPAPHIPRKHCHRCPPAPATLSPSNKLIPGKVASALSVPPPARQCVFVCVRARACLVPSTMSPTHNRLARMCMQTKNAQSRPGILQTESRLNLLARLRLFSTRFVRPEFAICIVRKWPSVLNEQHAQAYCSLKLKHTPALFLLHLLLGA